MHAPPPAEILADVLLGEVRMIEQDRAVDEADDHVGPAIAASHQRGDRDQVQRIGTPP
jgi:hypothetical protein